MDWEKVTTHRGYDLQAKNKGFGPRKKPCKDRVKAALAQKKQKCKSEIFGLRNDGRRVEEANKKQGGQWAEDRIIHNVHPI
jgi:hypothetical protein